MLEFRRPRLRGQLTIPLNNGLSKEETVELFIQLDAYARAASAFDCYQVAAAVFAEQGGTFRGSTGLERFRTRPGGQTRDYAGASTSEALHDQISSLKNLIRLSATERYDEGEP